MANTFTQIYIQIVFSVRHRASLIKDVWRENLHRYITGIIQNKGHKVLAVNSMPDHIHIFIGMKPDASLSDLVRDIKCNSSKWINDEKTKFMKFEWQEGYGAFSYSHSQRGEVVTYIQNQQEHHRKKSFREEYLEFIKKFEIPFDSKYLYDVEKGTTDETKKREGPDNETPIRLPSGLPDTGYPICRWHFRRSAAQHRRL